ncbi:hypothetical protein KLP99_001633 [Listeria monocytogenes]|nr:hypothetical protein [Listeria monocytogenes]
MNKTIVITVLLFLICSLVFVVKNSESAKSDYQIEISKLEKQNKELQEKMSFMQPSSNSSDTDSNDSKNLEDTILKQGQSDKILVENKKIIDILYNYNNYNSRQEKLNMYITDMLKEKMLNTTKAQDMHDVQIESKLIRFDEFIKFINPDKITVLNLVENTTSIEKTITRTKTIALIDYYNYKGTWKVSNISFIDTK